MKENIPGYPGYHVTRDGKVYSCLIQGGSSKKGPWKLRYTAITVNNLRLSPKVVDLSDSETPWIEDFIL